jgi:acetyl-CoA carboxylase biotin carboxyl carrier protein
MAMAEKGIDLKKVKELIEIMKQNGLEELEIKQGDQKIFLRRSPRQSSAGQIVTAVPMMPQEYVAPPASQGAETAGQTAPKQEENLIEIKSPIVGTFYAQPTPDSDPYVEVGSSVEPQTIVCIIEAMKVMNEIKAETSGTIAEVLVNNGQAVEYGQVLFKLRPD